MARTKKVIEEPKPIPFTGRTFSYKFLETECPDHAIGGNKLGDGVVPGDVRVQAVPRSAIPGSKEMFSANICGRDFKWHTLSLTDGAAVPSTAPSSNEVKGRFAALVAKIKKLHRLGRVAVRGYRAHYVQIFPTPLSGTCYVDLGLAIHVPDHSFGNHPKPGDIRFIRERRRKGEGGYWWYGAWMYGDLEEWRPFSLTDGDAVIKWFPDNDSKIHDWFSAAREKIESMRGREAVWINGAHFVTVGSKPIEVVEPQPDPQGGGANGTEVEAAPATAPGHLAQRTRATGPPEATDAVSEEDPSNTTPSTDADASRGPQPELFEHLPLATRAQEKPKRIRRKAGDKPEKPPQLPGFEDDKNSGFGTCSPTRA